MNDSDLLAIFWEEIGEYLDRLNAMLLQIETLASDSSEDYVAVVQEMNRMAHSMKGAARAVGIQPVEQIAYHLEEVFAAATKIQVKLTPDVCDVVYDGLDVVHSIAQGEPQVELSPVLTRLEALTSGLQTPDPAADSQWMQAVPVESFDADDNTLAPASNGTNTLVVRPVEESIRVTVSKMDRLMSEVTELFVAQMHGHEQQNAIQELYRMHTRWQREWRVVRASYVRLARRLQNEDHSLNSDLMVLFRFLEVNQRHLAESVRQLGQVAQKLAQDNLRLGALAGQLQDDISGLRLVSFETVAGGFQRMTRDLARDTGKQVALSIYGEAVEIDKAVLDSLKDPLMHLVRNAIDHGIELPEIRQAAGKSAIGNIFLTLEQRGSEIVIRVRDDGRGIPADLVRRKLVASGAMTEAEVSLLSDREIYPYVFQYGLSTSPEITALSGRGLGMDIVRSRIESLRGRVEVDSEAGAGTTITLRVPVSLTRIHCVMVQVGEQTLALPVTMILRMEKVSREVVFTVEGRDMLRVGERPLPLVNLAAVLNVPSREVPDDVFTYIALQTTDGAVAFEVDALPGEQELVLKPLGPELAQTRFVAGAALLGTGRVVIVLDAGDLIRHAGSSGRRAIPKRETPDSPEVRIQRILIVDDSITTRTLEKNILETAGFDVAVAIDGSEAWRMVEQTPFDVIISDVEMPNMDGLELTRRLKSHDHYRHIPIILLTSLSKPEQREAGLKAGANAYLVKSAFNQENLLDQIRAVI